MRISLSSRDRHQQVIDIIHLREHSQHLSHTRQCVTVLELGPDGSGVEWAVSYTGEREKGTEETNEGPGQTSGIYIESRN